MQRLTSLPPCLRSTSVAFTTTSTYMEGYIQNTSTNVNHGITLDGKLAVWVVRVTSNGSVASTTSAAYVTRLHPVAPAQKTCG